MKTYLKRCYSVIAIASIIAGLIATTPSPASADANKASVIPPNAHPYGATYDEWSARWWQWALSLPASQNPFFDEGNCANGANGQTGQVWFLTGVINTSGTAVRDCTVPVGKALFFPIINVECSTLEAAPFHGDNEQQMRACAKGFNITNVSAKIDGVDVADLERYRVESPLFDFKVPANNTLGVPAGNGQSVSNGYYLLLTPLSVGKHEVTFGGTFPDFPFSLNITYHLTVSRK